MMHIAVISIVFSIFFFTPDCQQFPVCLSLQQLDFIHILICAKGVGSASPKYVTSRVPIAHFES